HPAKNRCTSLSISLPSCLIVVLLFDSFLFFQLTHLALDEMPTPTEKEHLTFYGDTSGTKNRRYKECLLSIVIILCSLV
ncbi:MAG: hypothetical protein ACPLGZ_02380, partial [Candidatus Pelagibacter ubique]